MSKQTLPPRPENVSPRLWFYTNTLRSIPTAKADTAAMRAGIQ